MEAVGTLYFRRHYLIELGFNRETVHAASRSQSSKVRGAMTDQWLIDQGYPSIANQRISIPDCPKVRHQEN